LEIARNIEFQGYAVVIWLQVGQEGLNPGHNTLIGQQDEQEQEFSIVRFLKLIRLFSIAIASSGCANRGCYYRYRKMVQIGAIAMGLA
jgi:hypothetical protein